MVKHNNEVPHAHFHKDWDQRIRLWFNQPAKAAARREARKAKAAKVAPRPVNLLRSAVHCPTVKYNSRVRLGRGFSLEELRAAGVSPKSARNIGIAVDHRRKNRSEEHFAVNVDRLKAYKARLVVFPRKANKPKKGDATAEQIAAVTQVTNKNVLALPIRKAAEAPRAITAAERARTVSSIVRTALTDGKMWGMREKRAKINAEKKAAQSKKDAKKEDADE